MESKFYVENRQELYKSLDNGTTLVMFSGKEIRKTADEYYDFYASRNFVYLTGCDRKEFILMATKVNDKISEQIYVLPSDFRAERWIGIRMKAEEVQVVSGISDVRYTANFDNDFYMLVKRGNINRVALDLYKHDKTDLDTEAYKFAHFIRECYPQLQIVNILPQLTKQRTIKKECEIDAMRKAVLITKAGIEAVMKASKSGMTECQYRAEFNYALAQHGCLETSFPSIISVGANNFCIHYYDANGVAKDGDMVLNDVGAKYDYLSNDVSRAFPCNGKFNEKQKMLYTCAYNTSEYMFSIIKPGIEMHRIDEMIKEYNFEQLKKIGLCEKFENITKYMWHGGAHHVGFDTHDIVDADTEIKPGMVFCVDVGIYCEEWGIGFRLEDNCLVTEDGCENLTKAIPRRIQDIESIMAESKM